MSVVKIKREHITAQGGAPELYIDGKKTVPLWFALSDIPGARPWTDYAQKNIAQFAQSGINVVCVDTDLQSGWKENGEYDAEKPLKEVGYVVRANPNAKIVIRLHINAPYWWMRKNPDELIGYYGVAPTDSGDYGERLIAMDRVPAEIRVSYVSEKYHKECGEVIKTLCRMLKKSEYGDNVIGIQVAYGTCGEWHPYGKYYQPDGQNAEADYGKPMLAYFRRYLREKYQTEEALRTAYKTDETFENARLATPEERLTFTDGKYRFEQSAARAIDSLVCFQTAITTAISAFCKAVKESGENLLAGAFYGYFFGAGDLFSAMFEQERLFADKNVDFFAATAPYGKNKRTGNFCMYRHLAEAMRLNGVLFLNEMDQGYKAHSAYRNDGDGFYACESEEEYASVLKRNIMENILRGNGAWYYDHRLGTDSIYEKVGYWDKAERMATITNIQRACEKIQEKPFVKTADVLLVFDGKKCYNHAGYFFCNSYNSFDFFDAVMKSGAGVDVGALSDLQKCDLSRYKCVLFMECIAMSKQTYSFIKNTVMQEGRTVGFFDKCGLIVDGVPDEKNVSALVEGGLYMPQPSTDKAFYHDLFKRAGAHIYTDGGEVVVADNEMVMVHCKDIPKTTLRLHCGDIELENGKYNTVVYNTFTGEQIL